MGVYKKIGIRNIALAISELINWIRIYHFKRGFKIFISLLFNRKEFVVKFNNGVDIYLRNNISDIAIFKQVFLEQQYRLYQFPLSNVKSIIDAGANIGLAAIYFSEVFPDSTIISIEPETSNFELLKRNVSFNKSVFCENAAVWDKEEILHIKNPESSPSSFMVETTNEKGKDTFFNALTISSLMMKYNWSDVDIVKMDIEGAEKEIFSNKNCFDWLSKTKLLIIELHDNYKPNCTKTLFKALEPFEYSAIYHHENIFIHFNHAN